MLSVLDAANVVEAVATNYPSMAWNWLKREIKNNNKVLRLQLKNIIPEVAGGFADEEKLKELEHFYETNKHLLGLGKEATANTIAMVKRNIALKDHKDDVLKWFQMRYPNTNQTLSSKRSNKQLLALSEIVSRQMNPSLHQEDFEDDFDLF